MEKSFINKLDKYIQQFCNLIFKKTKTKAFQTRLGTLRSKRPNNYQVLLKILKTQISL